MAKCVQHGAVSELPQINYPDLPVARRREEIMEAMRDYQMGKMGVLIEQ